MKKYYATLDRKMAFLGLLIGVAAVSNYSYILLEVILMKRFLVASAVLLFVSSFTLSFNGEGPQELSKKEMFGLELAKCKQLYAKGKPGKCALFGKIQYVSSYPDVKVQVVSSYPDIKVQVVSSYANSPGKWQIVSSYPKYKVQKVSSYPDYKIKFVSSYPGCR